VLSQSVSNTPGQVPQLQEADRLDQDKIRLIVQRIGARRIGGSDNYLRSRQAFVPPDVLQDFVAGDMGKVKIEDDRLWAECCQLL
jgi:hypothetical protein